MLDPPDEQKSKIGCTDPNSHQLTNSGNLSEELKVIEPIRLPTFWPKSVNTWFIQVEAQFALNKIVQDLTKYNHVIAALPLEVAESVMDVLENPPKKDMYLNLKNTIIARNSLSTESKIRQLISDEEIGDRKPSDFYRHLNQLAGSTNAISEEFIKKLWLSRLPNVIKIALIPQSNNMVGQLLDTADKIWEAMQASQTSINAVAKSASTPASKSDQLDDLKKEINSLKNMMSELKFHRQSRSMDRKTDKNRFRSFSRSQTRSRRKFDPKGRYCYIHFKYGNNARNCRSPNTYQFKK